jgi:hypothetical protein
LYLDGNSDIIFDYYENGGQNVNSFSLTPFDSTSNTIAQSSIKVCTGVSPGLLDGSSYTYNGSATNPTISFQWQSSTDNITFTNISGATTEDYTPPTQTTTTTNVVRYYRRIVTAAIASGCSYTSNVATVITSPGVPATPGSISGTTSQCPTLTSQLYSISAVTNATSYNWTVPTGWTITSGTGTTSITVTAGSVGQNGSISVAAVNGCGISTVKTLAVTVNSNNTVGAASSSPTLCVNTALTAITHTTTGATGIGTATGLPTGVTALWASNSITISGTPTASGTFNYNIPVTGGCGTVNATGTIIVALANTASVASSSPILCINSALSAITHTTTGATGIGTATGLPTGVTALWASNTISISGTPTTSGTFNYSIPTTGGCGTVNATGTIVVNPNKTVTAASSTPTLCVNTALTSITHTTTGDTGIGTAIGLPTGVTAAWATNTITISGTPTASGIFNYSIPVTGGCGSANATGTISVNNLAVGGTLLGSANVCSNNNTTTLTLSGYTGTISKWQSSASSIFASGVTDIANTSATYTVYNSTSTTYYRAVITSGSCQVSYSSTASIVVTASPSGSFAYASYGFCNSINVVQNIATSNFTGVTGTFSAPAGLSLNTATGAILPSASTVSSSAYTVTYTIPASGGCSTYSTTTTVTIEAAGSGVISYSPSNICKGTIGTIAPNITGAAGTGSATWVAATPTGLTIDGSGIITPTNSTAGTYTITYNRSASGLCPAYSNSTTVTLSNSGTIALSSSTGTDSQMKCVNTAITNITYATTLATGATFSGLPTGVSGNWSSNIVTISGTPTVSGTFNYTVTLTGSCGTTTATGTITVNPSLSASVNISTTTATICSGTSVTFTATPTNGGTTPSYQWKLNGTNVGSNSATYTSTTLANNDVVSVAMTSNATTCLTGSPATSNLITLTVNSNKSASSASSLPIVCVNSALTAITHATTGATGIGTATGLPAGVTAAWTSNTITISGTPTASGAFNYSIPLTGGCGTVNATGTIIVNSLPIANIAGNSGSTTCSSSSVLFTVTGTANAIVTYKINNGSNSTVTLIGGSASVIVNNVTASTTLNLLSVSNGTCSASLNASSTVTAGGTTTWQNGAWSDGAPNETKAAIMASAYTSSGSISACSLTVTNNATVTISSGDSVSLSGALIATQGSTVTFNNNANLLQSGTTNQNSGTVIIKRNSSALIRQDYTLWSSPVAGQLLLPFSPNTLTNRFYNYNTATSLYDVIANPATSAFATAKGYMIRMPNNHPVTPTIWNGQFTGVPNNGNYSVTLADGGVGHRFNLIGNPYPSPINAVDFITNTTNVANITGTIYVWRKTNNAANPSYCIWTMAGFVANGETQVYDPNDVIQIGQGFFVEGSGNGSTVEFTNTMRVDNHANQFFKTTTGIQRNRIWLNVTNATGLFSQTMIGYMTNATQGVDANIDGKYINDGSVALATLIGDTPYAIQGRSLPFDTSDVVPLSLKVTTAGNYTISIDHVDGLFLSTSQTIYLKDNLTGTLHNLSAGGYSFTSESGTFTTRFEIQYQTALAVSNPTFNESQVVIYRDPANNVVITTGNEIMAEVKIFDITGRLLLEQKGINASQIALNLHIADEAVVIQIKTDNGVVVTKKYLVQRMTQKVEKNAHPKTQLAEDE